jgi:retron-type reverse transcriptase
MSDEQEVISGVPQGTVLASILFIIMISDLDEDLKNSIIRLFADDTKVSAKIRSERDMELLQRDLDIVYKWADENLMEFNEN